MKYEQSSSSSGDNALKEFSEILKAGGYMVCHPSMYNQIVAASRRAGISEKAIRRIRQDVNVQPGHLVAANELEDV